MDMRVSLWALLCAFGIFIVLGTSVPSAIFSIFILGVIPGTDYTLPLWFILTLYPLLAGAALFWIARQPIFIGEQEKPLKEVVAIKPMVKKKRTAHKQTPLKRRPRSAV